MVSLNTTINTKNSNAITANDSGKPLGAERKSHNIQQIHNSYVQSQRNLAKTQIPVTTGKAYKDEFIKSQTAGNVIKIDFRNRSLDKIQIVEAPPPFEPWDVGIRLDIAA